MHVSPWRPRWPWPSSASLAAQESAQALIERGANAEAAQRVQAERAAGNNDPTSSYLAGLAYLNMDQAQPAREAFAQLSNGDNEAWRAIGQSAIALIDGAMDEAVNEATKARDINGELGFAHYQLGLVQLRRSDWDAAAQALDRSCELMPELRLRVLQRRHRAPAGEALQPDGRALPTFMQLAPNAPERKMAQLALNALRG